MNKAISWKAQYYPFGGLASEYVSTENNLRFPGQYHDRATDLYYNMYRTYQPELGRYLTPDPIGLAGGLNLYGYAGQDPINYADFDGLDIAGNWKFFWDWVFERGDATRRYGPTSMEVREIMASPAGEHMRGVFAAANCMTTKGYYGTVQAYPETAWRVNNTAMQVGGFVFDAVNNGNGTVTYTIRNTAGRHSFFLHLPFVKDVGRGTSGFFLPIGNIWVPPLMGDIEQIFTAEEPLPCECPQ